MNHLQVYARVEKGGDQDLFVYAVEKCYARTSKTLEGYSGPEDVFFDNKCPKDETMDFSVSSEGILETADFSFKGILIFSKYLSVSLWFLWGI